MRQLSLEFCSGSQPFCLIAEFLFLGVCISVDGPQTKQRGRPRNAEKVCLLSQNVISHIICRLLELFSRKLKEYLAPAQGLYITSVKICHSRLYFVCDLYQNVKRTFGVA